MREVLAAAQQELQQYSQQADQARRFAEQMEAAMLRAQGAISGLQALLDGGDDEPAPDDGDDA